MGHEPRREVLHFGRTGHKVHLRTRCTAEAEETIDGLLKHDTDQRLRTSDYDQVARLKAKLRRIKQNGKCSKVGCLRRHRHGVSTWLNSRP